MGLPFHKMEAAGNDFVVVYRADLPPDASPDLAIALCDRHYGVGADGVLVVGVDDDVQPPELRGRAPLSMEVWNADGSVSEMCGNGLRCVVRRALEDGRWSGEAGVMASGKGLVPFRIVGEEIRTTLGSVTLGPRRSVELGGRSIPGQEASVGNPHFVVFADEVGDAAGSFLEWAPALERHGSFPNRTNVELVTMTQDGLRMRVWERGVGETLACGSGACAAAVVARGRGRAGDDVRVAPPGGVLSVFWDGASVDLQGPARTVFQGVWR